MDRMVARRVRQGYGDGDSRRLLDELLRSHSGDNLAHALTYEGFASEDEAYAFVNEREG